MPDGGRSFVNVQDEQSDVSRGARLAGEPYQKVDHRYMNGPAIDQVFADETGGNGVLWYLSDTQNTVRDVAKYASTTAAGRLRHTG